MAESADFQARKRRPLSDENRRESRAMLGPAPSQNEAGPTPPMRSGTRTPPSSRLTSSTSSDRRQEPSFARWRTPRQSDRRTDRKAAARSSAKIGETRRSTQYRGTAAPT